MSDQALNGQANRQVVASIAINVDVIVEQHKVCADEQFTCECTILPCLKGWAIVAGGEIDIDSVGIDADAQGVVQAERVN